ncbi:hypothetical protein WR25_04705 [Diploscapter pachys]|uniref:G-protein coupled receptors family 1 profile domain-containing protein n=1 Tax=Diploscapter pachys TaxID=2018661 RepID=A0A2A2KYQ0_9BILA|nr:hypothetical protein WR25_04705 [Diploscapter pachys]
MLWYDGLGCDMSIPQYEKYMIAEHIITMTAIVVNAFAAYCVITRSPVYMGKFKYCLLYHLFATALVDFLISAALVPILVLPFMAGYVLGFLKFLPINLLAFIAFFACGLMATTSVMLFAYRHYSILPSFHSHQLSRKGKIIGFILLHSGTLLWVPFVITEKSSEEFKEYLEEVVTPLFALIIPVGLLIGMTFRMVHGSDWINTCLAIISTHGMIGSTCLILVNPSYRRALWRPRGIASSVLIVS